MDDDDTRSSEDDHGSRSFKDDCLSNGNRSRSLRCTRIYSLHLDPEIIYKLVTMVCVAFAPPLAAAAAVRRAAAAVRRAAAAPTQMLLLRPDQRR